MNKLTQAITVESVRLEEGDNMGHLQDLINSMEQRMGLLKMERDRLLGDRRHLREVINGAKIGLSDILYETLSTELDNNPLVQKQAE